MKIKYVDWEIEKVNLEDFQGYDKRYYLEEIIADDGMKVQARIIIASNSFENIIRKLGEFVLYNIEIEFVENYSLKKYRKGFKK